MKNFTTENPEATEGERALMRIADALEAGALPDEADAELIIDAVALIRAMIEAGEPIEQRRDAIARKLNLVKPAQRPKQHRTAGDVMRGSHGPMQRAQAFWMARAHGFGKNEAIRQASAVCNCAKSTIKRAIKQHPEARDAVLATLGERLSR